jgi:carboxymethylenebutenolidase
MRLIRFALLLIAFIAAPIALHAAVTQSDVSFKSGNETIHGVLFVPDGAGKHPAIVVIHEWWGLTDWVKDQGRDFADHGYVALAVDLYRGKVATDRDTAHELMSGMSQDRALRDMTAAANYLASLPSVRADRIGAVGWCMGGGLALQLALSDPQIKAVAMNYGTPVTDHAQLTAMKAQVLGNFGALDQGITPDDVHQFEAALKAAGKPGDLKIYPDAGHGFENPVNKAGYNAADAADAHRRMIDFFARTLK